MRVALVVEYDGANHHGFQYQANAPSIQEELEKAVASLTGERARVRGAGRTDAGVHATGQVVAFDTGSTHPPETFVKGLNFYLPDKIAVKAAYRTEDEFDPRRMALSRTYQYRIECGPTRSPLTRRTAYRVREPLNVRRMRRAAQELVGRRDFASFAGTLARPGASTVREVYGTKIRRRGDIITIEVEGNAFLPHQVRRMAGALVDVGRGALDLGGLRAMVQGRPDAVKARSLPPHGLCLVKVTYHDFPPEGREVDGDKHNANQD